MFDLPWILLLAPFSILWWAFSIVLFLCAVAATNDEDNVAFVSVLSFLACIAYITFGPGLEGLAWMADNLKLVAMSAGGFAAVGVGWCCFKWFRFAIVARDKYLELVEQFKSTTNPADPESQESYIRRRWPFRVYTNDSGNTEFRPAAKRYKARIANWVIFWPLSMLWTGAREWLIALKDLIFECIGGTLNKISAWAWRGVDFK